MFQGIFTLFVAKQDMSVKMENITGVELDS